MINDTEIMPAPAVNPQPRATTKFDREMTAFRRLLPTILKDYRNKYVAIHEEQVVGSGDNLIKVALEAYDRFGYQPIYVDLVTDEPTRPPRIPRYQILSAW